MNFTRKLTPLYAAILMAAASFNAAERDVFLLARLIEAETGGEDWTAMSALGDEVAQALSAGRADTLAEVIFEYGAYESVAEGRLYDREPSALSRQAAYDALTK